MRDLAPEIVRQRLLIEGLYSVDVDREFVEAFLLGVAAHLDLRRYGSPIIHAPGGLGKEENEGFDAFIPLIDSGISLYVWSATKFFAAVLFTCKAFDTDQALSYTAEAFRASEIEHKLF
jgi:S-adenosylmethionine decarboxylase